MKNDAIINNQSTFIIGHREKVGPELPKETEKHPEGTANTWDAFVVNPYSASEYKPQFPWPTLSLQGAVVIVKVVVQLKFLHLVLRPSFSPLATGGFGRGEATGGLEPRCLNGELER